MNHRIFSRKLIFIGIISYVRIVYCGIQQQIDDTKNPKDTLNGLGDIFTITTKQPSTTSTSGVLPSSNPLNRVSQTSAPVILNKMLANPVDLSYSSTTGIDGPLLRGSPDVFDKSSMSNFILIPILSSTNKLLKLDLKFTYQN